MASKLRVVANDETTMPAKRHTVTSAAADGSRRDLLVAMRSRVATAVEDPNTPARDLAALTRRLMELAKDIEALDAAAEQEAQRGDEAEDGKFDASAI